MENRKQAFAKASEMLLRDHIDSEKLGSVCQHLAEGFSEVDQTAFLAAVMEKSPHKEVRAEATLALAYLPLQRARLSEELKKDSDPAKQLTELFGKELVAALQMSDPSKLRAESAKFFDRFTEAYNGVLSPKRLSRLCVMLSQSWDPATEAALRSLLAKDSRREVQGAAVLGLAKMLTQRADTVVENDAKEAAKLWTESESLLGQAAEKYADVEMEFGGSVGKQAKKELFSLRNLSIGKVAPDIEGEDQLGKKFSLGDYRGKVLLLDFWNEG